MANERDQRALLSLIQGAEGKVWSSSRSGWSLDTLVPVCEWEGISCRIGLSGAPAIVTTIHLPNTGLSASVPTELGWLTGLEELTLKGNLIRGTIPPEVARLQKLHTIDCTDCLLTGTLPRTFASSTLAKISLGDNRISGEFFNDDTSPHLQSLTEISLEKNLLTGTLHAPTIARMQNLETLSLSDNKLSGLIPGRELGSITDLRYLYLDSNKFVGPLPAKLAQVGNSNLQELWVQSNDLSGTVPASYERFDQLHDFFIDGNKLTGALPPDLCGPEINSDFFTDIPPQAERNYCDSIACPVGMVAVEGVFPCEACVGGEAAKLHNPYLGHKGDCATWTQRDILRMFYSATSRKGPWSGDNDWNDETKFMCDLTGIICDDHNNVIEISLKNRGLTGDIPDQLGFLEFLEILDLSDNDLTGYLPSDLRWTPLTKLDISGNKIRGVIPPMLCLMEELNGNGQNEDYNCHRIACPVGTFNEIGRFGDNGEVCVPCYDSSPFIAQKVCSQRQQPNDKTSWQKGLDAVRESGKKVGSSGKMILEMALGAIGIAICLCVVLRCLRGNPRRQYERQKMLEQDEISYVDYDVDEFIDEDAEYGGPYSGSGAFDTVTGRSVDEDDQLEEDLDVSHNSGTDNSASSSTRTGPIPYNDFIREQNVGSKNKKGRLTNAIKGRMSKNVDWLARENALSSLSNIGAFRSRKNSLDDSIGSQEPKQNSVSRWMRSSPAEFDDHFEADIELAKASSRRAEARGNFEDGESSSYGSSMVSGNDGKDGKVSRQKWRYSVPANSSPSHGELLDVPSIE